MTAKELTELIAEAKLLCVGFSDPRPTDAEKLLKLEEVLHEHPGLIRPGNRCHATPEHLAAVALAVRFVNLPALTRFRAVAEDWGRDRIIKEIW